MNPLVGALVLILLGLLGARLSFATERAPLGPRLIFSSGVHFLFLGFLLGSHVLDLFSRDILEQLYPFLALGLGWIGLLFGLQIDRRNFRHFPSEYLVVTLVQAGLAFLIFLGIGTLVLERAGTWSASHRLALLAAAATACVSTPAGIALISRTFLVRGRVSQLLFFIASLDAMVGILALQLVYALHHVSPLDIAGIAPTGLEWVLIAVALGAGFGVFFLWLTRPSPERNELVLFLLGLVVFAAGAALYLGLSPLFVAGIAGTVVANLSPIRRRVYALLQTWERPIYVILLILAGALLNFPTWAVVPLAAGYLLIRAVAKITGGVLATHAVPLSRPAPAGLGVGLIPQGGISLAMAISITLTYGALQLDGVALADVLFSTVVLGVVASELLGPFLTIHLLRRSGEIHPRGAEEGAGAATHRGRSVRGRPPEQTGGDRS